MTTYHLQSNDGMVFELSATELACSKTLQNLSEDVCGPTTWNAPIPLPTVSGKMLESIVAYCRQYVAVGSKDDELFMEGKELFWKGHLLAAANYLDIAPLISLCINSIVKSCIGLPVDRLLKALGVTAPLSAEVIAEIERYEPWAIAKSF